jgi:hypothetical protein
MSETGASPSFTPRKYIPASLSEIYDLLGSMILWAPRFTDEWDPFHDRNIDSEFYILVEGFGRVRKKLGEERYSALVDLATRAKALFADDQEDSNGKTDEGRKLLYEIEDIIQSVRRKRVATKQKDEEGEVSGD